MTGIAAVPTTYAGVEFRSTLEADWAATLDSLGIVWQYEPEAVRLPSGTLYRPDFYLPGIATWLEVKGPHMERVFKAYELAQAVCHFPDCIAHGRHECSERCEPFGCSNCDCMREYQLVVVGVAPERGQLTWRLIGADDGSSLVNCSNCDAWWWMDNSGSFGCRAHRRYCGGDDDLNGTAFRDECDMPFVRASGVTR